jgi:hypothetical protein
MSRQGQAGSSTSDWLVGAFKQNPEGLLLLAAGACLLLRKNGLGLVSPQSHHPSGSRGTFSKTVSGAQEYVGEVADRTAETVGSVASAASDYASKAGRAVGEQSGRVVQQAQSTLQGTANRILQEQPLAIALVGLAAGAAVAAAFPATDFEREHLGPIGDQMSDAAYRVGDQLKEATSKAGEKLKSAAGERGLNAEGLKEVASEVAETFSSAVMSPGTDTEKPKQPHHSGSAGEINKGGY